MGDSVTSLLGPAPKAPAGATGPSQTITAKFVPPPGPTGAQVKPAPSNSVTSLLGDKNDPMKKPIDSWGIDLNSQRDFLAASSDAERTLVLEKGKKLGLWQGYGNEAIIPGKPEAGLEWFVIQNGKKVAVINPFGSPTTATAAMASHPFESMAMGLSAFVPEFSGLSRAFGGAVETGVLEGKGIATVAKHVFARIGKGGVYALIRSAITGAAAATGTALDEANKYFSDVWAGSTDEKLHRMLESFLTGSASEFLSRLMSGVFGAPRAGYAPLLPAEHKATVRSTIDRGMIPGIYGATKGKSVLGTWEQSLVEMVFRGRLQEKGNLAAMKTEAKKQLMAAGFTPAQADVALQSVLDAVRSRFDRTGVNQDLRDRAKEIIGDAERDVTAHKQVLEQNLKTRLDALKAQIGSADPATQELAQREMVQARRELGRQADELYAKVDEIIAGSDRPVVVDWGAVKKKAREIWQQLPRDQDGKVVFKDKPELGGVLMEIMNMPEFTDFKTAQRARRALFDAGEYKNLTPGRNSVLLNQLGDTIDNAFGTADFSGVQDDAVKALREADAFWRENIGEFQGLRVNQLMSGRVRLEPEEVANIIFKRGMVDEAARFKQLMTPEGWANVSAAYFSKMTKEATNQITGELDPERFLAAVRREQNLLKVAFGDAKAAEILKFAEDNAAVHGKLPADQLTPGNFRTFLETWQAKDVALQEKLKGNYIHMLMDNTSEQRDAITYMLDNPRRIADAKAFYGENSPQWTQIKGHAMAEILSRGLSASDDPTVALFEHGGLSGALAKFSDAELTELFGADHARDLRQLGKDIDLVQTRSGRGTSMAGAFAAGAMMLHPFTHLIPIVKLGITGSLMANPRFVRWLATGFEPATQAHLAEWIRMGKMLIFMSVPGVQKLMNLQPGADQTAPAATGQVQ